tara:strand:- start:1507 stop:2298 length:792 start_codon:yes stop_codon:yes gene_type:complete
MRKNKLKKIFSEGKAAINGWLSIPNSFSTEVMAQENWDSLTIDMQHGAIDYPNALHMLQAISTTDIVPLARVNWNEPGQIMKILDAGSYGIICPMVSNREQAENFVQACTYPPDGYRSFGPIRAQMYGGTDYGKQANKEILKLAMIETKEAVDNLDSVMKTSGLDGIYIGPADLSLSIGTEPSFDKEKNSPAYPIIENILKYAKKNNIIPGIHNQTPEYAIKMIDMGFQFVTVGSDKRFISAGAKSTISKLRNVGVKKETKTY